MLFLLRVARISFQGNWKFYTWMSFLTVIALVGLNAWARQFVQGLSTTGLTDQISWGAYVANFTFLVGVAAAAVMLVIPAYVYKNEHLHEVVIFGELLAVAVIIMCLLFVSVDLGHPERFAHMVPPFGIFNFPISMLAWDVIALNGYLLLNMHICGYLLYMKYLGRKPTWMFYVPFVFLAIFWAISIHTVTAFLYVGLAGRPFWNTPIVAPRFLASAFTAGPALLVVTFQIIRKFTSFYIGDQAIFDLRKIITVSMIINVFLLISEVFTEFYADSYHVASSEYLFFGLHGHTALVPWMWSAVGLNVVAMGLLMTPLTRKLGWLNLACIIAFVGIWIEKGMGLIVPGFIPTPLGEVVDYMPTLNEALVCVGIWAFGALLYSWMLRVAIPILRGNLHSAPARSTSA
ncbi:polysulfide reductase NrfD [Candidatus Poribacteria bacterium]|nr:polysulfide reductase NrfD [Candidatus Poribacteria bacterium]